MSIKAMKQALEALEFYYDLHEEDADSKVIATLRAAIEQAQEPVAWRWKERVNGDFDNWVVTFSEPPPYAIEQQPLYTAPQPAQQPLTEKRINELYSFWIVDCQDIVGFTRAIERAAHGTKENT